MKKAHVLTVLAVFGLAAVTFAQGTVYWGSAGALLIAKTNATVTSTFVPGGGQPTGVGSVGVTAASSITQFYYELLVSQTASAAPATVADLASWFDTGLSAMNGMGSNGRIAMINPSSDAIASNWPAGTTENVVLVGWSANLGTNYANVLSVLQNPYIANPGISGNAYFGVSSMGTLAAGTGSAGITVFGSGVGQINASLSTGNPMQMDVIENGSPNIQVNGQLAVGTVVASVPAQVSISGGFPDGWIFYTLDGTIPSLSSQFYTEPFALTNTTTVQAICYSEDLSQSSEAPPVVVQMIPVYSLQVSAPGFTYCDCVDAAPILGYNGNAPSESAQSFIYGPYFSNSVVMLTANADDIYEDSEFGQSWTFDHWTGDAAGNQNPLSLTMDGPKNVQAVFTILGCNIGYSQRLDEASNFGLAVISGSTPGGGNVTYNGINVPPAVACWDCGTVSGYDCPTGCVATVVATASTNWTFLFWQGDPSNTNNPLTGPAGNYVATFGTVVVTNTVGRGSIVLSQPNPVPFGTTSASAVPNTGQYFIAWSGAANGTTSPTVVMVTNPTPTITALFLNLPQGKFSLAPVVIGDGSLTISPQQNYYSPGDTVTLTASGATFYGWTGDALGTNNPLVVTMNKSMVIQANFNQLAAVAVSISPQTQVVYAGSNAVVNANASGQQPLNYQWQDSEGFIAGATNATFNIIDAQPTNSDNYSVIVSNPFGSITSVVATVTVVFAPSIASQPSNQTVAAGTTLTMAVSANGTDPLDYQWQNSNGSIPGQTNSSLVLNPALTNYSDNYTVVISNPYGAVTSQVVTAFVYLPVGILTQPTSLVVPYSGPAKFGVAACGFPSPSSYQWTFNGTNLPNATSSTLEVNNVRLANCGNYQVQVGNGYSSTNSAIAALNISPSLITPFSGATTIWGRDATLTVGAYGSGQLTYQWYLNGVAIAGANLPSLYFSNIQLTNGGLYSVVVSSPYGSVTNVAEQVIVNPAGISLGFYPGLTINGVAGYSYMIQSSTDLADTNSWLTQTNLTLTSPVQLWIDTSVDASSPFNAKTFYKILPGQ